jgi:histidinol-phosphate/aromatic aminotransferase/cobyric acid decarboxylase-like protein
MLETKEIRAKRLTGQKWYEIDDAQDLDIAESIFANNISEQYDAIAGRYGGYWRYPKLLDFCYLVNPYFPPKKMVEEIKSNFTELMSQYPSGLRVNSLLAAKNFGLEQEHIVVGNGAAELIKSLMENSGFKRVGFIRPTFEEYPNRLACEHVIYDCAENDFRYSAEDIMSFFDDKEIDAMVLINPDNPTGNYIPVEDLITLAEWTGQRGIAFVVDESFVDFVSMEDKDGAEAYTLLKDSLLRRFGRLYVVKSISKSYGVPGFRLGILASSDENTVTRIKKDVAIWNINSYGEFFMQILQKYHTLHLIVLLFLI